MPSTHTEFNEKTGAFAAADAFASNMKDKIIFITGVNLLGIGGQTARAFAAHSPRLLILSGRNEKKVKEVIDVITKDHAHVSTKLILLDLSDQKSVRKAAQEVLEAEDIPHLDILINNAAVGSLPTRELSEQGIEMHFATNHVGHFLFMNLIMSKLIKAAERPGAEKGATRIINVSSGSIINSPVRFSDTNLFKTWEELPEEERYSKEAVNRLGIFSTATGPYLPQAAYGQSKTANVLFGVQLNELLFDTYGILSTSLHPGFIGTELSRYVDPEEMKRAIEMGAKIGLHRKTLDQGASTTMVAALDPALTPSDFFLSDCQSVRDWVPKYCTDATYAKRLWHLTEDLVSQKFEY